MNNINDIFLAIFAIIGVVVVAAAIGLLMAFPVMWCWNYVMPHLFGLKTITWGQAWCLNFLCHLLIKSSNTNKTKE